MTLSDVELFAQWGRDRDTGALTELVSRHIAMVYGVCRRMMENSGEAAEVAAACFTEIVTAPQFNEHSLAGGLHALAVQRAHEHNLSWGRMPGDTQAPEASAKRAEASWEDIRGLVDREIAALPVKLREPVVLRFLEAQLEPEIAKHLEISRETVQLRMAKGVKRLARQLQRRGLEVSETALTAILASHASSTAPAPLTDAVVRRMVTAPTAGVIAIPLPPEPAKPRRQNVLWVVAGGILGILLGLAILWVIWGRTSPNKELLPQEANAVTTPAPPSIPPPAPMTNPAPALPSQPAEEKQPATAPLREEDLPTLDALFLAALREKLQQARTNAANLGPLPLYSADIPPENALHDFLAAVETFPPVDRLWLSRKWERIRDEGWAEDPELRAFLVECRPAFEAIRAGIAAGTAALPLPLDPGRIPAFLPVFEDIGYAMALEAVWFAANEDPAAAFDNVAAILDFAVESTRNGVVDNGLTGYTLCTIGTDTVRSMLPWITAPPPEFRGLTQRLEGIDGRWYSAGDLIGAEVQAYEDWLHNEFQAPEALRQYLLAVSPGKGTEAVLSELNDSELNNAFWELINDYQGIIDYFSLPFYASQQADINEYTAANPLCRLLAPNYAQLPASAARADALLQGTILMSGIRLFQAENRMVPATLDELLGGYLSALPPDPFSGGPFLYTATERGYLLYSTGTDGQDDGGIQNAWSARGGDLIIRRS